MRNYIRNFLLSCFFAFFAAVPAAMAVPSYKIPWLFFTYGIPAYALIVIILGIIFGGGSKK